MTKLLKLLKAFTGAGFGATTRNGNRINMLLPILVGGATLSVSNVMIWQRLQPTNTLKRTEPNGRTTQLSKITRAS